MKNRQLKFRAWTGAKMEYDVMVGRFGAFYVNPMEDGKGLDPNDSASLTSANTIYGEETPIMQFTVLYDKNGKEIWEGDIIKIENWFYPMAKIMFEEGYGYFGANNGNPIAFSFEYLIGRKEDYEVIGNIFENPELLNNQ